MTEADLGPVHQIGSEPPSELNQALGGIFQLDQEIRRLEEQGVIFPEPFSLEWARSREANQQHRPGFFLVNRLNRCVGYALFQGSVSDDGESLKQRIRSNIDYEWSNSEITDLYRRDGLEPPMPPTDSDIEERLEVFVLLDFATRTGTNYHATPILTRVVQEIIDIKIQTEERDQRGWDNHNFSDELSSS